MKSQNCIFISVDSRFLSILTVCLSSIAKNYPNHPDVIICHTNLREKDINRLKSILPLTEIHNTLRSPEIGPIMKHLPKYLDPKVFYARLLIWRDPIFQNYNNILYLDADTLVLDDCDAIFLHHQFYIVKESYTWDDQIFINNKEYQLLHLAQRDDINIEGIAWNAGVFMLPKKYNTQEVFHELLTILSQYSKFIKWADQSVFAIWLMKRWFSPSKNTMYNFQHRLVVDPKFDHDFAKAKIIHFNGIPTLYRLFCMRLGSYLFSSKIWRKIYRQVYHILQSTIYQ